MKINSINKNDSSENEKNIQQNDQNDGNDLKYPPRKSIKPKDDSFLSDINSFSNKSQEDFDYGESNSDIIMEGNILYRYTLNQIELEGNWSMGTELNREKFSYLFKNKKNFLKVEINPNDIEFDSTSSELILNNSNRKDPSENKNEKSKEETEICKKYMKDNKINIYICNANIFEVLLIPSQFLFNKILEFLSGEYHGYFFYLNKTIEDRFNLNFYLEDNKVNINGEGGNNLGDFKIIGYANFCFNKENLIAINRLDTDIINFGMIRLTRVYNTFDSNENNRVIKSFQHTRKRMEELEEMELNNS